MCLKRKKMYEKQVQQLNGTRMTLETQLCAIENQSMNVEMFKAMQMGSNIMKQSSKELYFSFHPQSMHLHFAVMPIRSITWWTTSKTKSQKQTKSGKRCLSKSVNRWTKMNFLEVFRKLLLLIFLLLLLLLLTLHIDNVEYILKRSGYCSIINISKKKLSKISSKKNYFFIFPIDSSSNQYLQSWTVLKPKALKTNLLRWTPRRQSVETHKHNLHRLRKMNLTISKLLSLCKFRLFYSLRPLFSNLVASCFLFEYSLLT